MVPRSVEVSFQPMESVLPVCGELGMVDMMSCQEGRCVCFS